MPSASPTDLSLHPTLRPRSAPLLAHPVVKRSFDPTCHCSERCARRWRDDAECLGGHASEALTLECDGRGRLGPLLLSKRVTAALLERSESAFANDLSDTLETMLEMYLDVIEAHGREASFPAREASVVYYGLEDMERVPGRARDVGTLEEDVRIHFYRVHTSDDGELETPEPEWPAWQHALLRRIRRMSAAGQAAVFDRMLRATRMTRRRPRAVEEALVNVGLTTVGS